MVATQATSYWVFTAGVEGTNALMIRASVLGIFSTSQVASEGITSEKKRGSVNIDRVGHYGCFGNSWFHNIAEC